MTNGASQDGKATESSFALYWRFYGRWSAVRSSKYTWISLGLAVTATNFWWRNPGWIELATATIPNLLGFALGGLAILVAAGDERFRRILSRRPNRDPNGREVGNLYTTAIASIVHFIVMQGACLLLGLWARALNVDGIASWLAAKSPALGTAWFVGVTVSRLCCTWLFFYSVSLVIAAALIIFRVAHWYGRSLEGSSGPPPARVAEEKALPEARSRLPDVEAELAQEQATHRVRKG